MRCSERCLNCTTYFGNLVLMDGMMDEVGKGICKEFLVGWGLAGMNG